MVMVQLGQGEHMPIGSHLRAPSDLPSCLQVMRREGQRIRAWVQCVLWVVVCMLGKEHVDAQGRGRRNVVR